jgi:MFS transporter, DHA1 family, inner membrane transport protein
MNHQERLILIILAAVNFTHIMDFMIMMPLGPQLMQLFQINPQEFGWAVSAYSITAGISGFTAAFFVDRFDRKKVLFFAYIGFIIGTFSCAFAPTYLFLVAARILAGLFGGMIGAQVLSIVGDAVPYERRGQAMGVVMTAFSLASVAGVPAGLWLASKFSWHAPFLVVGGVGLLVIAFIYWYMPSFTKHLEGLKEGPRQTPLHVLTDIWSNANQRRAILLSVVLMLGHFSIIPYIAPSLVGNAGYSQEHIFLIYFVGGLLTIFTSPLVGRFADLHGKYRIFALFCFLSLLPIWLITNLWPVPMWIVLGIAGMFFIFVNGRMVPVQAMVSSVAPPQQRGGFMGINSSMQQLASGAASAIGGAIVVQDAEGHLLHYPIVGYFSMTLILVAVYLAKDLKPNS